MAALVELLVPLATLALVPKCPACVAAYVLVATGIGLSIAAATAVRWLMIAVSLIGLSYLLFRRARKSFTMIT